MLIGIPWRSVTFAGFRAASHKVQAASRACRPSANRRVRAGFAGSAGLAQALFASGVDSRSRHAAQPWSGGTPRRREGLTNGLLPTTSGPGSRAFKQRTSRRGAGEAPVSSRGPLLSAVSEVLVNEAAHLVREGGLPAIFVLMLLESALIPIPSEATMLFAGFAVAAPGASASQHHLTLTGVVLAGVLGNLFGSWLAYGLGRVGRVDLIERHGHVLHMKPSRLEWADRWFERYGSAAVLFSRMLPIIRTFISLPAGVARMPFWRFTALTVAGCLPWVLGLALLGEAVGSNWESVRKYFEYLDYAVLAAIVILIAYAVYRHRRGPGGRGGSRPMSVNEGDTQVSRPDHSSGERSA